MCSAAQGAPTARNQRELLLLLLSTQDVPPTPTPCLYCQGPFPSVLLSSPCNLFRRPPLSSAFFCDMLSEGPNNLLTTSVNGSVDDYHQVDGCQVTFYAVLVCMLLMFYNEHTESEEKLIACLNTQARV